MKRWAGWTVAAMAVAASASAGFACDRHAPAAEAKDTKDTKVVAASRDAKGCDMPCCAHAKAAAVDPKAAVASDQKPCAGQDSKGCPKKAGTAVAVAKAELAKDAAKPEPPTDPGTHR